MGRGKETTSRPILIVLLIHCCGICVGFSTARSLSTPQVPEMVWSATYATLIVGLVLSALARQRGKATPLVLIMVLCFGTGYGAAISGLLRVRLTPDAPPAAFCLTGVVDQASVSGNHAVLRVTACTETKGMQGKKVMVRTNKARPWYPGERVSVVGRVAQLEPLNPGEFDYQAFYWSRGISAVLRVTDATHEGDSALGPSTLVHTARTTLAGAFRRYLPSVEASFLTGIILGDASQIPDEVTEEFRQTGVLHILSVSGLHVQFALAPVAILSRRIGRPFLRLAFQAIALLAYAMLTGAQSSVVRSAVMALAPTLALCMGRNTSTRDTLPLACLGIVLVNPLALFDPGFQMSASATAGLVFLSEPISRALGSVPPVIRSLVSPTLAAQLATVPLLSNMQGVNLQCLLANPVTVPLSGLALSLGMAASVTSLIVPVSVVRWILLPAGALSHACIEINRAIASTPSIALDIPRLSGARAVAYYAVVALLLGVVKPAFFASPRARCTPNLLILLLIIVLGTTLSGRPFPPGVLTITFVSVGQGDACLIVVPGGTTILIDCGTDGATTQHLLPFLLGSGVLRLDYLLATHRHADHLGGYTRLSSAVHIGAVLSPKAQGGHVSAPGSDPSYSPGASDGTLASLANSRETCIDLPTGTQEVLSQGWMLRIPAAGAGAPELVLQAIWPPADYTADENDRSAVLHLTYGSFAALFMGDCSGRAEQALLSSIGTEAIRAQVLKVGHHGSRYSTIPPFVSAASPVWSVISVGPNVFGHPSDDVIQRLISAGSQVLRTDRHGAVTFITDGRRMQVKWHVKDPRG